MSRCWERGVARCTPLLDLRRKLASPGGLHTLPAMSSIDCLRRMAHNNAWANLRLHRAISQLTDAEYRAERTSFFPSLHLTLVHTLFVDRYYLDALEGGGRGMSLWPELERFAREEGFLQVHETQRVLPRRGAAIARVCHCCADAGAKDPRPTNVFTPPSRARASSCLLALEGTTSRGLRG